MLTESVSSLLRAQNIIYFDVFSACILVYDYILTFSSEMTLIWGEPWKSLKVLFLLSRYLPFADTAVLFLYDSASSPSECRALTLGLGTLFAIGLCMTEYIFAVRTWAMWGCDRKVGMVLVTLYLASWLPSFVIIVLFVSGVKYLPPTPLVHGCNEASANSMLLLAHSGIVIIYWLVLIVLMVAKGGSPWNSLFREDLFNILYRDGLLYCCFLCGLVILNMIATTWQLPTRDAFCTHKSSPLPSSPICAEDSSVGPE
ncbi:hypothetical protein FIBSPDRAFT_470953 [Athelia psychrophila]|uniref:DUF6533 domain-containing protein n=1 Tax=Athelia psychrophila TaxID=1759441 RepID=A0A166L922_9AGAM|nr:hypothetical protein FIBSPDRAFT_470953 [Fibularhizoctonia sp. CBS 109695]